MKTFLFNSISSFTRERSCRVICFYGILALLLTGGACHAQNDQCHQIDGADLVLKYKALILIGEIHGTDQIPRFVGDLICAASQLEFDVKVGLEIPNNEMPKLRTYLASNGGLMARAALLNDVFWKNSVQDGRRSAAIINLIDRIRGWKNAGKPIELSFIDEAGNTNVPRDKVMAENVKVLSKGSDHAITIVLTGNIHSRITFDPKRSSYEKPMGVYLQDFDPISLDPRYSAGSAWFCSATCSRHEINATSETIRPWTISNSKDEDGQLAFGVGPLNASLPAAYFDTEVETVRDFATMYTIF